MPEMPASREAVLLDETTRKKLALIALEAARQGDVQTLEAYFKSGLPGDVTTPRGDTLLILATYHGRLEAVKVILEHHPGNVDALNGMGFSALAGACYKGHTEIGKLLIEKSTNVDAANRARQTPLMFAALFNGIDLARLLVEKGANVELADAMGNTAISLATRQGHDDMVTLLEDAARQRRWEKKQPATKETTQMPR